MSERIHDEGISEKVLTVFQCGPNRECDHAMDHYRDIVDANGRVCGTTLACSKCGETAFNLSMWDDY